MTRQRNIDGLTTVLGQIRARLAMLESTAAGGLPFRFETMHHSYPWMPNPCRPPSATGWAQFSLGVLVLTFESLQHKTRIFAIPGFAL